MYVVDASVAIKWFSEEEHTDKSVEIMEKILAQIPLGRLGKPSEVAGAVVYLVSEVGDYITGQVIDINGGLYI